jgi:hypothetical protein
LALPTGRLSLLADDRRGQCEQMDGMNLDMGSINEMGSTKGGSGGTSRDAPPPVSS